MGNMIQSACDTMQPTKCNDKGKNTLTPAHIHTTQVPKKVRQVSAGVKNFPGRCRQVSQKVAARVSAKYAANLLKPKFADAVRNAGP